MKTLAEMDTPIFWAEGHPGALDRENWEVKVTGVCDNPQTFSWNQILALPQTQVESRLTSVTRWSVNGLWKGVALRDLLDFVGAAPSCRFLRFWSVGYIYDTSIPIDIALRQKSLLAHSFNGDFLTEDYGGPLRGFIPYLWGYKSAKSVVRIDLMEHYISGYWELRGYTDSATIEAGPCRDMNDDGAIKEIQGPGEVFF